MLQGKEFISRSLLVYRRKVLTCAETSQVVQIPDLDGKGTGDKIGRFPRRKKIF